MRIKRTLFILCAAVPAPAALCAAAQDGVGPLAARQLPVADAWGLGLLIVICVVLAAIYIRRGR